MGCESDKNKVIQDSNQVKSYSKYDPKMINKRFNEYISQDDIRDYLEQKYNLKDPIFQIIRKKETELLTSFYKSKKIDFENNLNSYLNDKSKSLNFVPSLTNQIIEFQDGREIFYNKIKKEIEDINLHENKSKIENLTAMVIGQTGTGKSTLINSLLRLEGSEKAETGDGDIVTTETQLYQSKKVPYLKLIDTRGIELSDAFNTDKVGLNASLFIQNQLKQNNINNFVHCIWYCISSGRFQGKEIELVNNLILTVESSKIPLIIVMTQSDNIKKVKNMKNKIKEKGFDGIIDVLAEGIQSNEAYIKPYGLDKLVDLTIKKCEGAFNMDMKQVMIKNLKKDIKNNLFINNKEKKKEIILRMMMDSYEKKQANQEFDSYIIELYNYSTGGFLGNELNSSSKNLIKNSEFNKHKENYFLICKQYEEKIVTNELPFFANKFLDIQATIEKEKKYNVEIGNKRNYNDFINTTKKFLDDNFKVFYSKIYINFIVRNAIETLSESFEKELNSIVEHLMNDKEIINLISGCFYRKFSDFQKRLKNFSFSKSGYINNQIYNDGEERSWLN